MLVVVVAILYILIIRSRPMSDDINPQNSPETPQRRKSKNLTRKEKER